MIDHMTFKRNLSFLVIFLFSLATNIICASYFVAAYSINCGRFDWLLSINRFYSSHEWVQATFADNLNFTFSLCVCSVGLAGAIQFHLLIKSVAKEINPTLLFTYFIVPLLLYGLNLRFLNTFGVRV